MSRLHTRLRAVLFEDPVEIDGMTLNEAAWLGELLEVNRLEPLVYHRLREHGDEGRLSPERLTAWKMSYVLSVGRSLAFAEVLEEIVEVASRMQTPIRLLRGTQLAFFVYPRPELRPLNDLEIQTPPERAAELQNALRRLRFLEMERRSEADLAAGHRLPRLARDGVTVSIHRRSTAGIEQAPWDPFSDSARSLSRPRILRPDALTILLAHELALRRYSHCLLNLHDLHVLVSGLRPDWRRITSIAAESGQLLEVYIALRLACDVLGTPVEEVTLAELKEHCGCHPEREALLLKLARTACCQYPASWRLHEFLGRLLGEARRQAGTLAAST